MHQSHPDRDPTAQPDPKEIGQGGPVRQRPHGYSLFYSNEDRAGSYLPALDFKSYSRSTQGIGPVSIEVPYYKERSHLAELIQNPSHLKENILSRQAVVANLLESVDELTSEQKAAYDLTRQLDHLLGIDSFEGDNARFEKRAARTRIQVLIDEGVTSERVEEWREFLQSGERDPERGYSFYNDLSMLLDLERGIPKMRQLARSLMASQNEDVHAMGAALAEKAKEHPDFTTQQFLETAELKDEDRLNRLAKFSEGFDELNARFGAVLSFVRVAKRDQMVAASFNLNEPQSHQKAWNFVREKEEIYHDSDLGQEVRNSQVRNDSPADLPITILCGSNMSGKSFFLEQELYLQLCAQAFGYIPAEQGNCHIYDSFVFLDRESNHGARQLSAFGKEVGFWNTAFKYIQGNTFLLADESYSTTSPEDQYRLLVGTVRYLRSHGVRLMIANHNEQFLKWCQSHPETGMYHFATEHDQENGLQFLFNLTPGLDESRALEVARSMGMPNDIVDTAEAYLRGEIDRIEELQLEPRKLERYTEEERERLKQEAVSFRSLVPRGDEIIFFEGRGDVQFYWRFADRDEGTYRTFKDGYAEARYRTSFDLDDPLDRPDFLKLLSDDKDFEHFQVSRDYDEDRGWENRFITELFFYGGTNNSKDLLERQQLFRELSSTVTRSEVREKLTDVYELIHAVMRFKPEQTKDFNKVMFDQAFGVLKGFFLDNVVDHAEFVLNVARLNVGLLELDPKGVDLEKAFRWLELLRPIERELQQVSKDERDRTGEFRGLGFEAAHKLADKKTDQLIRKAYKAVGLRVPWKRNRSIGNICRKMLTPIKEALEDQIVPLDIEQIEPERLQELFDPVHRSALAASQDELFMPEGKGIGIALNLGPLVRTNNAVNEFVTALRQVDSVHLSQFANYFEPLLKAAMRPFESGRQYMRHCLQLEREVERNPDRWYSSPLAHIQWYNVGGLFAELAKVRGLLGLGECIEQGILNPVAFSQDSTLKMEQGCSVTDRQSAQEPNGSYFSSQVRAELVTGANMSGKTYYLKQLLWNLLSAHSTGFAPSKELSTPILDTVVYLDRVNSNLDMNLSAFGNEVKYWNAFLKHKEFAGELIAALVDEAFSTTSPRYQDALSYAVTAGMLRRGHLLAIASHNHEFLRNFMSHNGKFSAASHFETLISDSGTVQFNHRKQAGHRPSQAIPVARALQLPEEIIQIAELTQ